MGENETDARMKAYSIYKRLHWIQKHMHGSGNPGDSNADSTNLSDSSKSDGVGDVSGFRRHRKLEEAIAMIKNQYPDFEESEHPDFLRWGGKAGIVLPVLRVPVEKLIAWIDSDMPKALELLASAPDTDWRSDFWHDTIYLLETLVSTDINASLALLEALADTEPATLEITKKSLAVEAVLQGLSDTAINGDQFTRLRECIGVLYNMPENSETRGTVSSGTLNKTAKRWAAILLAQIEAAGDSIDADYHHELRQAAIELWDVISSSPAGPMVTDGMFPRRADRLMDAINHPAGKITEFWMKSIEIEWRQTHSEWSGLPQDVSLQLEKMLASSSEIAGLVEVILVSSLRFLGSADLEWAQERVLPLLDFKAGDISDSDDFLEDPIDDQHLRDRAWHCWSAYLCWGGTDNAMLESGLDDLYLSAAERIWDAAQKREQQTNGNQYSDSQHPYSQHRAFPKHMQDTVAFGLPGAVPLDQDSLVDCVNRLCAHLAAVCAYSDQLIRNPLWIRKLTSKLPIEGRQWFIRAIGQILDELDTDACNEVWDRWFNQYWQDRIQGIPDQLSKTEAGTFAELTVKLKTHTRDAINMSHQAPAALLPNSRLPWDLCKSPITDEMPDEIAGLVLHLLSHTDADTVNPEKASNDFQPIDYVLRKLEKLLRRLQQCGVNLELVESIVDESLKFGGSNTHLRFLKLLSAAKDAQSAQQAAV